MYSDFEYFEIGIDKDIGLGNINANIFVTNYQNLFKIGIHTQ